MASAQSVGTEHRLLSAEEPLVQTPSLGEGSNSQTHTKSKDDAGSLPKITLGQAIES